MMRCLFYFSVLSRNWVRRCPRNVDFGVYVGSSFRFRRETFILELVIADLG